MPLAEAITYLAAKNGGKASSAPYQQRNVADIPEEEIRASWEAGPKYDGVPYPDYRNQVLNANIGSGNTGTARPAQTRYATDEEVTRSGGSAFLADLAHQTSGDLDTKKLTAPSDGSIDTYRTKASQIDEALASPGVSDARKAELRQAKAELDEAYYQPRETDAKTTIQNAGSDADALKALQALEGLRTTSGGGGAPVSGSGAGGAQQPGTRYLNGKPIDESLANGLPVYDPEDKTAMRKEYDDEGWEFRGVSWEQYQQMVKDANPSGALRYTSTTAKNIGNGGTAKTFAGISDPTTAPGAAGSRSTAVRNAEITRDGSLAYYDNVTQRALNDLGSKNKETDEAAKQTLAKLAEQGALTKQQNTQIANKLSKDAESSNAESSASTQRLTKAVDTYKGENNAALASYKTGIQPYQNEISGTSRQNVAFDPEGLGLQRASYQQGGDIYGGSLDYTSQAAQAYANPEDIARSLEGLGMLRENATTGGDDQRENLRIARDEYENGGKNQEHIYDLALDQLEHGGDKQREVYDRYKEISHPEMTADERNILAQSQRQYATLDKSNRDAVGKDLEARGVMSGAAQIAGQQAAQQRLGEERVAGTLGAQAQSVQRAFSALQGMQGTADSIRVGDQNSLSIAGKAATDLRTGNQNAEQLMQSAANALRAGDLAAAQAYTAAAQRQREQGFAEEYARGQAADTASANNQSTRLGGAQIQANQANAIRTANDNVNMFNNEQQGITDRYNTSFKQSEYQRLTGLQQDTFNNTNSTSDRNLGAESGLHNATQQDISDRFGRTNTAAQTQLGVNGVNWGIDTGIADRTIDEGRVSQGRTERETGTRIDAAGRRVDVSRATNADVERAMASMYGL